MDAPITPPKSEYVLTACFQKQPFDTRMKAVAAAKRINGAHPRRQVTAYRCGCCYDWHIGGARKNSWRNSR